MPSRKTKNADSEKAFEGQHDDEEVIFTFRRHFIVLLRNGIILFLLALLVGILPMGLMTRWPIPQWQIIWLVVFVAVGLLKLLYEWIGWYFTITIVTDQRLIQVQQRGLFDRSVVDMGLGKIQNVNYQISGIIPTIYGFGTILVQTYVGDLVLRYVYHPDKVQTRLIKTIKDAGFDVSSDNDVG